MNSIARGQYPQQVWKEGVRHLWTPVHRRPLKNRPEERVRLRVIEYLLQCGWPKSRISTEETVSPATAVHEAGGLRTDLICYSRSFDPMLLVECKSQAVRIDDQTALQAARYNRDVGAPFLLMTNGRSDHWYEVPLGEGEAEEGARSAGANPLDGPPQELELNGDGSRTGETNSEYWTRRGFLGSDLPEPLRANLVPLLERDWRGNAGNVQYLDFTNNPLGEDIDHYYAIRQGEEHLVACSLQSAVGGGTRFVAVLNRDNRNVGMVCISLAADPEEMEAEIYTAEGRVTAELPDSLDFFEGNDRVPLDEWALEMEQLFVRHS